MSNKNTNENDSFSSSDTDSVTAQQLNSMLQTFMNQQHQHNQLMQQQMQQNQQLQQQMQQQMQQMMVSSTTPASSASVAAASANPIFNSNPHTSSSLPSKVKIAAPSNFTGNNRDINVESWLWEMVQYLDTCDVADNNRINVARNYLKQTAQQWWYNQCHSVNCPTTWDQFAIALRNRFQPVAASRVARSQLHSISQGKMSLSDYCSKFFSLLNLIPDMAEADQLQYFINGLNRDLQLDVVRSDPHTLQDAMMTAQRMDTVFQLQKNYSKSYIPFSSSSNSNFSDFSSSRSTPSSSSSSSSSAPVAPMELGNVILATADSEADRTETTEFDEEYGKYLEQGDEYEPVSVDNDEENNETVQLQAIQQRNFSNPSRATLLSREEFARCMSERLCLRCKKPGHIARNCNLPPRRSQYQSQTNNQYQSNFRRGNNQIRRNF